VRKREEIAERSRRAPLDELRRRAQDAAPVRGFVRGIRSSLDAGLPAVIAEIKKASPSKGLIRADFNPVEIARCYESGGASCLSVLTDRDFFQGAEEYLVQARSATALPVLRKDFVISRYQVIESRAIGADCILLIVAAIEDDVLLTDLVAESRDLGLDVLVEVHDSGEMQRALSLDIPLIGVNNRDLRNFETRLQTSLELRKLVTPERILVTESGIHTRDDVALMREHDIHAFLVGESLMRAEDPGARLRELFFPDSDSA